MKKSSRNTIRDATAPLNEVRKNVEIRKESDVVAIPNKKKHRTRIKLKPPPLTEVAGKITIPKTAKVIERTRKYIAYVIYQLKTKLKLETPISLSISRDLTSFSSTSAAEIWEAGKRNIRQKTRGKTELMVI
eukprot:snap_masked-scaffold_39-processed-gene-1.41-mRNA-1 protein AED:1.00 eAED:1.00 QI:0/-1/0/0/-1/1/1/0/131